MTHITVDLDEREDAAEDGREQRRDDGQPDEDEEHDLLERVTELDLDAPRGKYIIRHNRGASSLKPPIRT